MQCLYFGRSSTLPGLAMAAVLAAPSTSLGQSSHVKQLQPGSEWTAEMYRQAEPLPMPELTLYGSTAEGAHRQVYSGESQSSPAVQLSKRGDAALATILFELEEHETKLEAEHAFEPDLEPAAADDDGAVFTHSRVFPNALVREVPYQQVGKLFIHDEERCNPKPCTCSGAVIQRRVILTAAHCLYTFDLAEPRFFRQFRFFPAYYRGRAQGRFQGLAPFGEWHGVLAIVPPRWVEEGVFGAPNAVDFGILVVADQRVGQRRKAIGDVLGGWLGWKTFGALDNHVAIFGYPSNLDAGEHMQRTDAQTFQARFPNSAEFGSFQGKGASGGPFVEDFGIAAAGQPENGNRVVGVFSYLQRVGPTEPRLIGTSILNEEFVDIFRLACASRPGNCRLATTVALSKPAQSPPRADQPALQHRRG